MKAPEKFVVRDQREPGWFFVDNEIIDKYGARLGAYGVALYGVLCRHCKNPTQRVSLSQRDMAATLGISQARVRKSLGDLVGAGLVYLEVPERPSPGMISTVTLLKVKATERHTLSSTEQLSARRSPNKEVKIKTETKTPLPFLDQSDFALEENARARDTCEVPPLPAVAKAYGQEDFDARDLRRLADARRQIELKLANGWGAHLANEEILAQQCALAGVSVKRAREVWARAEIEISA